MTEIKGRFGSIARFLAVVLGAVVLAKSAQAVEAKTFDFVNNPAAHVSYTDAEDVSQFNRISIQAVYADGTPSDHQVVDGTKSTAQLSVIHNGLASLSAAPAVSSITIVDNNVSNVTITINTKAFKEGVEWSQGVQSSNTAVSLKNAIDAYPSLVASTGTVGGNATVVFASAAVNGTYANSWTISSDSSSVTVQGTTLSGGRDNAQVCINNTCLTQGTDWNVAASSDATCLNIHNAIRDNSTLAAIIVSTPGASGVLFSTAIYVGVNAYPIYTSTPTALVPASGYFTGGTAGDIDYSANTISESSHGLITGVPVWLEVTGTAPDGLTDNATYYAIKTNDNVYQLATSTQNAVDGTSVDVTTATVGGSTIDVRVPALSLDTDTGFKWQASNDGSNWFDIPSISSITYSAAGTTGWDLGEYNYKWIRMNYLGPTWGALDLKAYLHGIVKD